MIILRHAKFISGAKIYKSGETLPDTADARALVARGLAEVINTERRTANSRQKKESEKSDTPQQNNEVNT